MGKALVQCDCCDYFTIPSGDDYEICPLCYWEQDAFGIDSPDKCSSANHGLTLRQGRRNFEIFHSCAEQFAKNVIPAQERQKFKRIVRQLNDDDTYIVDCINVQSENEFWDTYVNVIQPQGAEFFGKNLDAFWDALNGGPGYPGEAVIYFINTSSIKGFEDGRFYSVLKEIMENSGMPVYVE